MWKSVARPVSLVVVCLHWFLGSDHGFFFHLEKEEQVFVLINVDDSIIACKSLI